MPPSKPGVRVLACLGVLLSGAAIADASRMDVVQVIDLALAQNPTMAAAAAKASAKEWELKAARQEWNPTAALEAKTLYGSGSSTSFFAMQGSGDPDEALIVKASGPYASLGVTLSMPLYMQGTWAYHETPKQAAASAQYDKSQLDGDTDALALANLVFKNYLSVFEAKEEARLYGDLANSRQKVIALVRQKIAAQAAIGSDLVALLTAQAATMSELRASERKHQRELAQLRVYLGLPREAGLDMAVLPTLPSEMPKLAEIVDEALTRHPEIRAKQSEVVLSTAQLKDVEQELGPSLSVSASATTANGLKGGPFNTFYSVGVGLSLPLLDSGKNAAKVGAKNANLLESQQRLLMTQNDIAAQVRVAFDALLDTRDAVEAQQQKLEQSLYEAQATRKLQQQGASTLDQLIEQENAVLSNRILLLQAHYKAWNAYADLLKSTGQTKPPVNAIRIGS